MDEDADPKRLRERYRLLYMYYKDRYAPSLTCRGVSHFNCISDPFAKHQIGKCEARRAVSLQLWLSCLKHVRKHEINVPRHLHLLAITYPHLRHYIDLSANSHLSLSICLFAFTSGNHYHANCDGGPVL